MRSNLHRDSSNKVIAGVCAGLGNYFMLDPVFFRLFFLIIMFFGGGGILLYVLLWVLLPIDENYRKNEYFQENTNSTSSQQNDTDRTNIPIALLLLSAGIMLLVNNIIPGFNLKKLWPIILIVIGIGIILSFNKNSEKKQENE
ncbi:MAG: PspC domain-containing protein [Bacteroidetes bacterium]|nr:PspC domain-containing protein [Bacteroidota bacterium]